MKEDGRCDICRYALGWHENIYLCSGQQCGEASRRKVAHAGCFKQCVICDKMLCRSCTEKEYRSNGRHSGKKIKKIYFCFDCYKEDLLRRLQKIPVKSPSDLDKC